MGFGSLKEDPHGLDSLSHLLSWESSPPWVGSGGGGTWDMGGQGLHPSCRTGLRAGSHSDCCEMTNWLISNLINAFMLITKKKKKAAVEQLCLQEQ